MNLENSDRGRTLIARGRWSAGEREREGERERGKTEVDAMPGSFKP